MSKRFALCRIGSDEMTSGLLEPIEWFEKLDEARKRVRTAKVGELVEGEYALIEFCNQGITVGPPPETTRLTVDMGTTFLTRKTKPRDPNAPPRQRKPKAPKAPANGSPKA